MKALLRLLAFFCAVVAFVLLVIDGTTAIAADSISFTSIGDAIARLGDATTLPRWRLRLTAVHPWLWGAFSRLLLPLPALAVMLLAAGLFWRLGRRNEPQFTLRPRDWVR